MCPSVWEDRMLLDKKSDDETWDPIGGAAEYDGGQTGRGVV